MNGQQVWECPLMKLCAPTAMLMYAQFYLHGEDMMFGRLESWSRGYREPCRESGGQES